MTAPIPFLRPTFPSPEQLADAFVEITDSGIFSNGGPAAREFRHGLALRLGCDDDQVSLTSSGTTALELAVQTLFDRGRTQVLVASFTFAAGPLVVSRAGFEPVFVDIDPVSWQPSLDQARSWCATNASSLAGILLTSTFGVANPEIAGWEALAEEHGVRLIVDSAAGFGSTYHDGEPLGLRGDCEVFSFHATKTLAIGEGGAARSRSTEVAATIDRLANFGFDAERRSVLRGTNAKLCELSSKIGTLQLAVLEDRLRLRQAVFTRYRDGLEDLGVTFQPLADRSALPFVSAAFDRADRRDAAQRALGAAAIETRAYYNPPVHRHPVFDGATVLPVGVTDDLAGRILSLPMSDTLTPTEVGRACAIVADAVCAVR
ncbi:MAG TPA: aminotransferase class I/II-fold pyridoxal phosphate-dependent enzyme [Acidimicrobiales bacterium]